MSVTGGGILRHTHPCVLTSKVLTLGYSPHVYSPLEYSSPGHTHPRYSTPWALTPRHTPKKWPGTRDLIRFQPFTSIHFLYSTKGNTDADICKFKGSTVQISHTGCWIALSHTITSFIHWYAPLVLSWLSQFHKKGLIKGKLYFVRFVY